MPGIKIVTHCFAELNQQYATMLRVQISSVIVNPPSVPTIIEVYCAADDVNTQAVLDDFLDSPILNVVELERERLWRRSIGRDQATRTDVDSDLIWFADCDYLFGPETLDHTFSSWKSLGKPEFVWPRAYLCSPNKV